MTAAMLHFESGVPINDCHLDKRGWRDRLARVSHVYWIWKKNPFLDTFELFKQLVKNLSSDRHSAWHMAQKDQLLLDFVTQHVAYDNRKVMEARVRASANHLMKMGMETDNAFALADGAKIAMKLDRLDQPESEQADMSKVMFLPPVVTTQVTDVAPDKTPVTDEQALAIINKYNAHQDSKRLAIDERVNTMMAKRDAEEMTNEEDNDSKQERPSEGAAY